jgi:hypothetical protein
MPYASVEASPEVEVYGHWALILARMTHASAGADPWTIVPSKPHPAVAEPEFTPLDLSYIRIGQIKSRRREAGVRSCRK